VSGDADLRDRAAITGIGQTAFGRDLGRSELDLACEAILAACDDAGIGVEDIDGVVRYGVEQVTEVHLLATLGIPRLRFMAETPSGGGGLASTVFLAALAVSTGAAAHVLCFRSRCRSRRAAYGADPNQGGRPWEKMGTVLSGTLQWHHPFGVAAPVQEMALIARRHMHVFGTRAEAFGLQAVAQRAHAAANPAAMMRTPISLDDWRAARMIADPIRLVDCSLECDGAVAVIVSAADRARDLRHPPAWVMAAVQGEHPIHVMLADYLLGTGQFDGRDTGGVAIGRRLFGTAGITPGDVDAAMIFDHFSPAVAISLEQYGFCGLGEGGPFIESGATRWPEGSLPVNTHGGSNGEAFIHGFNHLPEAVRQLRGDAVNQVQGCEVVLVTGAITDPSGAVLLHR
jgi:acetyl-CoA acetyltransferase